MNQLSPPALLSKMPRWRPLSRQPGPPGLHGWLADTGSLTHRLSGMGHFSVTLLRQGIQSPRLDERWLLGMPARRQALIREVLLSLDGTPVVYARSVIPLTSLRGRNRILGHMAGRSLGAELFRRPRATRRAVWVAQIPPALLPEPVDDAAWGRQSLFLKRGQPLLVAEVFLPALWT